MPPPGVRLNIVRERQEGHGVGTLQNPEMFLGQDYELLQQYYLIRGRRYIDDMFPPDNRSYNNSIKLTHTFLTQIWIHRTSHQFHVFLFFSGNCCFLAALGALTFQKHIMEKFWRFWKWVDVVIDDKLSTLSGELIFVKPKTPNPQNEFWPALLEKAYAKACGSYGDMISGNVSEALMDFTGGVHMKVTLRSTLTGLWDLIDGADKFNSLMGCSTAGKTLPNGLVEGHAYTVTGVRSQGKPIQLVRLFNPWGDTEWTGDWSDRSPMWETVSPEERERYHKNINNGKFWMSVEDFRQTFSNLDICSLSPGLLDGSSDSQWTSVRHERRLLAGTYLEPVVIALVYFFFRSLLSFVQLSHFANMHSLKFESFLVCCANVFCLFYIDIILNFSSSFFANRSPVAYTKDMKSCREVMEFFRMEPGEYLIVPYTSSPNQTASFLVTILSKTETQTE
uniref:Si:ch211-202f3.3 n=1 Tax=Electrophorus electricus TaxID=8005 RepID=A0A4W4HFN5_ELEEL